MLKYFSILAMFFCSVGIHAANQDDLLNEIILEQKLNAPFVADLPIRQEDSEIAELGAELFFSPDISMDGTIACSSCHHPDFGGADGVALPVGIGGGLSKNVGAERIKAAELLFQEEVIKGLIPRNTPTVFNTSLYRKNMFWDGRIHYIEIDGKKKIRTGFNVSAVNPTEYEELSILQTQARMPLTSTFEMKGLLSSEKNNFEIEQSIVEFLRSQEMWCKKFSKAFNQPNCKEAITLITLTRALAFFEATLVFTESPFENYIKGKKDALNTEQKKGALLFFTNIEKGGLGCVQCHSGKIFSDESFHDLGIATSGVGANDSGYDFGRRNVDRTVDKFKFKTPSLLNITETAPYFYNGTAATLEEAVRFHIPGKVADKGKNAIQLPKIYYDRVNRIIEEEFYSERNATTRSLLPTKIADADLKATLAFLQSLTDPCLQKPECRAKFARPIIESPRPPVKRPEKLERMNPESHVIDYGTLKQPKLDCKKTDSQSKDKRFFFTSHADDVGINHERKIGLVKKGWLTDVLNHGGVSVSDVNNDCLDDVVFDAGANGLAFYTQSDKGQFVKKSLPYKVPEGGISPLMMDLDGDYKQDLFVGNAGQQSAYINFDFVTSSNTMSLSELKGPVINASITDVDHDEDMDIVFAFWRSYKSLYQEHMWHGDGQGNLMRTPEKLVMRKSDHDASNVSGKYLVRKQETPFGNGDVSFTPNFADIDNDGDEDLLLASDFVRSQVLRNDGGVFTDITQKEVIDESNGMGAAVGDFSNTGLLDWYVTSINYEDKKVGGNNFYKNMGAGVFKKLDNGATIYETAWSWGACAKDFNNDGFLDIFYVSGYGEEFNTATYEVLPQQKSNQQYLADQSKYRHSKPKLLLNDQKGGFIDKSKESGFDLAFDGRGIACFDYEQDGDIDILVTPIEGKPRLYKNHLNGTKNWLAVRIVGLPKNTESFGAKVFVYTKIGKQYREVRFENNYISRSPAQVEFGLGDLEQIDKLVIEFPKPNAKTLEIKNPEINKLHIVYQDKK